MASGRPSTTHSCPGKCGRQVRRTLFACPACWGLLPAELQDPIVDNHLLNRVAHLAAMSAACDWYRANHSGPGPAPVEERCLHEMLPGQCAFCLGKKGPEEESLDLRARLLASGWFAAQYASRCDTCDTPFPVGTAIRMANRGWRAECCAEEGGLSG